MGPSRTRGCCRSSQEGSGARLGTLATHTQRCGDLGSAPGLMEVLMGVTRWPSGHAVLTGNQMPSARPSTFWCGSLRFACLFPGTLCSLGARTTPVSSSSSEGERFSRPRGLGCKGGSKSPLEALLFWSLKQKQAGSLRSTCDQPQLKSTLYAGLLFLLQNLDLPSACLL